MLTDFNSLTAHAEMYSISGSASHYTFFIQWTLRANWDAAVASRAMKL